MVVKIRLARMGKKRQPFYNIVVANARTARNSKPLEVLGTFDPKPRSDPDGESRPFKQIQLDLSRAKYWLGVGAQPSDPAWRLLSMAGLLDPKLSDTIKRDRAKRMDAIYQGEQPPDPTYMKWQPKADSSADLSPAKKETTEQMVAKLHDMESLL